jgi:hypothetical protein
MAKKTIKPRTSKRIKEPLLQKKKLNYIFWMLINYLTLILVSAIIFGFSAFCEYLVFRFIWGLLAEDIQKSEVMKNIASVAQVGILTITLIGMLIHSGFSIYGQFQIEKGISLGDE